MQRNAPPGSSAAAAITAARNEAEAFHLIVRAPADSDLSGVSARAGDLLGAHGLVPADRVRFYREHYVRVETASTGSPYPAGEWPDALIPFANPETGSPLLGGRFPAAPFDVSRGSNQPLYVEVHVPPDTPPGTYSGVVTLTADNRSDTQVPFSLRVRNFALPDRPSLRSNFTSYGDTTGPANYFGLAYGSGAHAEMVTRFNSFLLEHRLSPNKPSGSAPYVYRSTGHIDTAASHPALRRHFDELHATGWSIPFGPKTPWADPTGADRDKALTYLREMADYLTANGWFERTYIFLVDEPDSAAEYETIRRLSELIHSVRSDYKILATEQTRPDDPSWGSLDGAVDLWVPLSTRFDEPTASAAVARGDEVWSYTEGSASPAWMIDQPVLNYRIPAWINWRYGQKGILYWTPWYWEESNPWDGGPSYTVPWGRYNGNGCLVYPGTDVGYVNGPIASFRLKALRDGVDDYEYLQILSDLGESSAADAEAFELGTSWSSWNPDPAALRMARERLGDRIEGAVAARG